MNRSTTAAIAVATLLLGSGAGAYLFTVPAYQEQQKLTAEKASLASQKTSLEAQVADLEARVKRQAMGTISYFDLRTSAQQKRELEAKTVETLASLTEIFNDNKIDVQGLEPKGESQGLSKPVPSVAPSATPAAGASPGSAAAPAATPTPAASPSGPPTEPPVQLTHKAFEFKVRGEYPNLVKAMTEIQGLPRAISVNQFEVALVEQEKGAPTPKPGMPAPSDSLLQMTFQVSITYLMGGGLPAAAPGAPAPAGPGSAPVSMLLYQWALDFLGAPAYAAEVVAPAAGRARFAVTGMDAEGPDLVVRTGHGVPRFRVSGGATRLVIELDDTAAAGFHAAGLPGVRSVSARPSTTRPGTTVIEIATDGARFRPELDARFRLRLRRVGAAARVVHVATPVAVQAKPLAAQAKPVAAQAAPTAHHLPRVGPASVARAGGATELSEAEAVAAAVALATAGPPTSAGKPGTPHRVEAAAHAGTPHRGGAAAPPATTPAAPAAPRRTVKAAKADAPARPAARAPRTDTAGPETWSQLADRAAMEWAARQGADPEAFKPPVAGQDASPSHAEPAASRPTMPVGHVEAPAKAITPGVRPGAPAGKAAARVGTAHRVSAASPPARTAPIAHDPAGRPTRVRGVDVEGGALVVRTDGPAPAFRVLGRDHRSLVLELDQALLPGSGRSFPVGEAGVKQVRAALFANHPPRVRLVVDTDGSVAVHPVVGPDGVLRLRLAERGVSGQEVRLASAGSTGLVTTVKENVVTDNPQAFQPRPAKPAAKPKPSPSPAIARRSAGGAAAEAVKRRAAARRAHLAAVRRAEARLAETRRAQHRAAELAAKAQPPAAGMKAVPGAKPTPMAVPQGKPGATPAPGASPGAAQAAAKGAKASPVPVAAPTAMPTAMPTPPGPQLTRSLTTTYSFPIDRSKITGRKNPFKPITKPKGQFDKTTPKAPVTPVVIPGLGAVVVPPGGGPAVPIAGMAPVAPPTRPYVLGGVLMGGGAAPMALISLDGRAYTVGLNDTLPGNAKVIAIKADHVILTLDGRAIRLNLKR